MHVDLTAVSIVAIIFAAVFGAPLIGAVASFLTKWREAGGGKEAGRLRQDLTEVQDKLAALQADYEQLKADHNDMLLGLETSRQRLEARLDRLAGIDVPAPDAEPRPPVQRQL